MLGKVSTVDFVKCYPSRLKNFFKRDYNYKSYDAFIPNTKDQVVGNLPHEIIELFDKSQRADKVKMFYSALGGVAKYIRAFYKESKKTGVIKRSFDELAPENVKMLDKTFSKFLNGQLKGVLPKGTRANLSYVDRGAWGNVYKLSISDKNGKIMHDKALKVFHDVQAPSKSFARTQGVGAEANIWTFLKNVIGHKMDKTQFTRHYISDLKNAYSITEFADKNIHKTTAPIDFEKLFKMFYTDFTNEMVNDKIYDVGGFSKYPKFIDDKVVLKYFKKLMNRNSEKDLKPLLTDLQKKIQNPKTPHVDKIKKALELFEKRNEPLY